MAPLSGATLPGSASRHEFAPAFGWYVPALQEICAVAPIAETKLPGEAGVQGPRPDLLNVPAAHDVVKRAKVTGAAPGGMTTMSRLVESRIASIENSLSKLPPFSSIVAPAAGASLDRTVTKPLAGEVGDSVYCSRSVSRLVVGSVETQRRRNDSRAMPLSACVTMLGVDVGETDEPVGSEDDDEVSETFWVVTVELSGLVLGDAGVNDAGVEIETGVEI